MTGLATAPVIPTRTIRDRMEVISRYVAAGRVLDVGCVDARPERETTERRLRRKDRLLFRQICQINPETTGVDLDADGVALLQQEGLNAVCADVLTMNLGRRFDVVVAGEIIEHLENPGQFLRNLRRHLEPSGVLILSTANPFYSAHAWRIWRRGRPRVHEDHALWLDPITMSRLLRRTGFEPFEACWVASSRAPLLRTLRRLLRPYFNSGFMMLARPVPGSGT